MCWFRWLGVIYSKLVTQLVTNQKVAVLRSRCGCWDSDENEAIEIFLLTLAADIKETKILLMVMCAYYCPPTVLML